MRKKRIDSEAWRLFIDGAEALVSDVRQLRRRIGAALRKRFAEVQLVRGERPEHNLFALFNGGHAVMSYTRNMDEASYSARSSNTAGAGESELEFYLSNGQRDEFPVEHTIPSAEVAKAFEYFFRQEELPPWVKWHRDF